MDLELQKLHTKLEKLSILFNCAWTGKPYASPQKELFHLALPEKKNMTNKEIKALIDGANGLYNIEDFVQTQEGGGGQVVTRWKGIFVRYGSPRQVPWILDNDDLLMMKNALRSTSERIAKYGEDAWVNFKGPSEEGLPKL